MPQAPKTKKSAYPTPPPEKFAGLRSQLKNYPASQTPVDYRRMPKEVQGSYDVADKNITLNRMFYPLSQGYDAPEQKTAAHEYGHAVWYQDLDPFYKNFWNNKFSSEAAGRREGAVKGVKTLYQDPTTADADNRFMKQVRTGLGYPGVDSGYLKEALEGMRYAEMPERTPYGPADEHSQYFNTYRAVQKRDAGQHAFAQVLGDFLTDSQNMPDDLYNSMVIITGLDPRRGQFGNHTSRPRLPVPPPKGAR